MSSGQCHGRRKHRCMLSDRNSPADHTKRTMGLGTHRTDQRNGAAKKRTRNAGCRRVPLTESCGMARSGRTSVRSHQQQIRDVSHTHWHNHPLFHRVARPHLRRNTSCTPKQPRLAIRPHRQMWCQRNPTGHDGRERSHRTLVRPGPCVRTSQLPTRKHPGHPPTNTVGNARTVRASHTHYPQKSRDRGHTPTTTGCTNATTRS